MGGRHDLGMQALNLCYNTPESREGVKAFLEKREPEFRKHAK
jgi:2-ketocyclohexanecarboxyl-CoA hydrolase